MHADPLDILKQYWGYSQFRPKQEDIIRSVLLNRDTLALMPTGGGKSLCFQVPALCHEGICIVVSPLVALMKDQVDRLKEMDIRAAYLTSAQRYQEMDQILESAIYGKMKFLYVSPERLKNELFIERFKQMKVNLIAVDEAHCISQWGHDFRPAYREIAEIRKMHPKTPVIAVTASATKTVVKDVIKQLEFKDEALFELPMTRPNLNFAVIEEPQSLSRLVRICKKLGGSGIVYSSTRKSVRDIAEFLNESGIHAGFYHAGIDPATKDKLQTDWVNNLFPVMVATNAFGMGIDKPDVRFVVHLSPPQNLENYVQEAGRAGRDGNESWAILLYTTPQLLQRKNDLAQQFPDKERIRATYHKLCSYLGVAYGAGLNTLHNFNMREFCERYKLKSRDVFFDLETLSVAGYIHLSEGVLIPSRMMFQINAQSLYDFQIRNADLDPFIRLILRTYGGMFENYSRVDERYLAAKTGWSADKVRKTLIRMDNMDVVSYQPQNDLPILTLLTGRHEQEHLRIPKEAYEERKERVGSRWEAMMEYIHLEKCRTNFIAHYFGDKPKQPCGHCDVCRSEQKQEHTLPNALKNLLRAGDAHLVDVVHTLNEFNKRDVIDLIDVYIDEKRISRNEDDILHWMTAHS